MTTGFELVHALTWLYGRLAGDATLAAMLVPPAGSPARLAGEVPIYEELAPVAAVYPFLVYGLTAPAGSWRVNGGPGRILEEQLVTVQALTDHPELEAVAPIVARVDLLLDGQAGPTSSGGYVHACTRDAEVAYTELESGRRIRHAGGTYRLRTSTT